MTITKHTPVVVSDDVRAKLDHEIERDRVDLRRTQPPPWLDQWLEQPSAWRGASTGERREMAAVAFQREWDMKRAARMAAKAPVATETPTAEPGTPERIHSPFVRVRPGSAYVACANGCGVYVRRSRPAVARCGKCPRPAAQPAQLEYR